MRRFSLWFFIACACSLAAGNTCTLKDGGGGSCTGSNPTVCSLASIAADSTHSYWTGTGCTANGYTPSSDYLVVPEPFVLKFDQAAGSTAGNSTAPIYPYVVSLNVTNGGTLCGSATAAMTIGSASAIANGSITSFPHITLVISGGVVQSAYMEASGGAGRPRFAPGSAAPTVTVSGCTGTTAVISPNLVTGSGTAAIEISGAAGGTAYGGIQVTTSLTIKGDVSIGNTSGGASTSTPIVQKRGSTITFDSSASADGFSGHYIYGLVPISGYNGFGGGKWKYDSSDCTSAQQCTLTANAAGANTYFDYSRVADWVVNATYTNFSYVGSYLDFLLNDGREDWTVTHSTFSHHGLTLIGVAATNNIVHQYNSYSSPASFGDLAVNDSSIAYVSGTRNVSYNVFNLCVNATQANSGNLTPSLAGCNSTGQVSPANFTWTGNYFPTVPTGLGTNSTATNNFFIFPLSWGSVSGAGARSANYFWYPAIAFNPHLTALGNGQNSTGDIFDITEDGTGGGDASPVLGPQSGSGTNNLYNEIILPSKQGHGNGWASLIYDGSYPSGNTLNMNHATFWGRSYTAGNGQNSVLANGHNSNCGGVGTVGSFKANLVYGLGGSNTTFKFATILPAATACLDLCTASTCDYNAAYNFTLTATCVSCNPAGGGRGYLSNTTSGVLPGPHDLDVVLNPGSAVGVNPSFADSNRNAYLWDTKYLGHALNAAWVTSTSYTAGSSAVSDSHAGVYGNAGINYSCILSHTSNAQTEPEAAPLETSDIGSGLTSIVVSGGIATVTTAAAHQLAVGSEAVIVVSSAPAAFGASVLSVPSSTTFTANVSCCLADATYTTASKLYLWQAFWEPASLVSLRSAIAAGTLYTDVSLGDSSTHLAVDALVKWVSAGLAPQNPAFYYTFPGDTNSVTNVGAVQMLDRTKVGGIAPMIQ